MGGNSMIISNSTPLINFSAIRRLDILEQLFGKIHIPKAVEQELLEKGREYPSAAELKPRAREGRDRSNGVIQNYGGGFNPRAHEGRDHHAAVNLFQSTRPRGARQ